MKNAADLLHTIANNHGVALPADTPTAPVTATHASARKPSTNKRRRTTQDEDDNATPSDASEAASSSTDSADSAQTESQASSQTLPVQIADAGPASAGDAASTPGNASSSSNTYPSTRSNAKNGANTGDENSDSDSNPLWLPLTLLATGGVINYYHNTTDDHTITTPSPTGFTVSGTAVLGPVVAGHSLTVVAYRADGSVLQQATLNPDGSYTLTVTENYTGALLLRLVDANSGADYRDEASGAARDLGADLRAATVIAAPGSYTVHINPLTELAVRQLGLAGGDNAGSAVSLTGVSASAIAQANSLVAAALGLSGTDIVSTSAIAAVLPDGSANPAVNALGLVLAAFSGMEDGRSLSTEHMLQDLSVRIADSSARSALVFDLIAGLANVDSVRDRIGAFAQSLGLSAVDAQAAASAWSAIFTLADGSASTAPRPSAQGYAAIGITGMQPAQASLLGDAIGLKGRSAINSVSEVQSLANIAAKVMRHAAGLPQAITQAELETLGITSLNPARLAALLDTLAASADDGSGADTLPELQAMVDAIAPGAPSFDFASPSGEPARPYVVNIETAAVPLTGAVAGGATTVTLQIGSLERVVTVTNGEWSYTLTDADLNALGQGTVSVVASARDAAGNTSEVSASADITIETVPPGRPTINRIADDNIINAAERDAQGGVVISGTCEDGASVSVQINGSTFAASVGNGLWSLALSKDEIDALSAAFSNGQVTFSVSQTDAAGNTGPAVTDSFQIDTAVDAPTINTIATDNVISIAERDAQGGVTITGTREAGAKVFLSLGLLPDGTYGNTVEIPAATGPNANATTWRYVLSAADYVLMGQGGDSISVVQQDAAGNTSSRVTQDIEIDFQGIAAPTINTIATDNVINQSEINEFISGTKASGNSITLRLTTDPTGAGGKVIEIQNNTSGTWAYQLQDGDLPPNNGTLYIFATQVDAAGNASPTTMHQVEVDLVPPEGLSINPIADDRTINASERTEGVTISGNCEPQASVLFVFGTHRRTATVVGNTWSYTLTNADYTLMGQGRENFSVVQLDAAGNPQEIASFLNIDTNAPAQPAFNVVAGDNTINAAERDANGGITLTGTRATILDSVRVYLGAADTNGRQASVSGLNWSLVLSAADVTALGDGIHAFSVIQTDIAGNPSQPTTRQIEINTAVDAPTINAVAGDNVISVAERDAHGGVTITGTREAGAKVLLSLGLKPDGTYAKTIEIPASTDPNAATTWSYTLSAGDYALMGEGPDRIRVVQQDAAGNTSAETTQDITVGNPVVTAPNAPTIDSISSGPIINAAERDASVTISGTKDAGASVSLRFSGIDPLTGQAITVTVQLAASDQTTWSYVLSAEQINAMGQGPESFTATQTDAAGNVSAVSGALDITIDTSAPAAPPINLVAVDDKINLAESTELISGTKDSGNSIVLRLTTDPTGTGGKVIEIPSDSTAAWSYQLQDGDLPSNGTLYIFATQVDAAGNFSPTSVHQVEVDLEVPQGLSINRIAQDGVINAVERAEGVTITGNRASDANVTVRIGNSNRTATVSGNTWSYRFTEDDYRLMGEGLENFSVTQSDAVGNTQRVLGSLIVDTQAPTQPVFNVVADNDKINAAERDASGGITLTGTRDGTINSVRVYLGATDTIGREATVSGSNWSLVLSAADVTALGDGRHVFSVIQSDRAGNPSPATSREIEIDTTVAAPTINAVAVDGTIDVAERDAPGGVVITGTREAGAKVFLSLGLRSDGTYEKTIEIPAATGPNANATTWSYTLSAADYVLMDQGPDRIRVVQQDAAGNFSAETTQEIIVGLPVVTAPNAPTIDGISSGAILNAAERDTGVTISGTKEAGASVSLRFSGIDPATGQAITVTVQVPASDQTTWYYVLSAAEINAMGQGPESFTATQTDAAGNVSVASAPFAISVDTVANGLSVQTVAGNDVINLAERNATAGVAITGSKEAGASVVLRMGLNSDGTYKRTIELQATGATTWSYVLSPQDYDNLGQGTVQVSAVQTDSAGNASTATLALFIDTLAPAAPTLNPIGENSTINLQNVPDFLEGTKDAGSSITVRMTRDFAGVGGRVITVPSDGLTNWAYALQDGDLPESDGKFYIFVAQIDGAGNASASERYEYDIDRVAPPAPVINTIAEDNSINAAEKAAGVTITGTCDPGARVRITVGSQFRNAHVNDTTWSYTMTDADYALLVQDINRISVQQIDAAGNISDQFAGTRNIVLDTQAPTQPGFHVVADNDKINAAERDASGGITLTGTRDGTINSVRVYLGATDTIGREATVSGSNWSLVLSAADVTALGDGRHVFSVIQSDRAGNPSPATVREIEIDTTVAAPAINTVAGDNTISVAERDAQGGVTITGTREAGAKVFLSLGLRSDGTYEKTIEIPASTDPNAATTWSYTLSAADYVLMDQGPDRIRVVQQDAAGNTSAETTQDITVGNTVVTAPNAPTIDGISGGPIINAAERDAAGGVVISGTKDAGASVSLRFSGIDPVTGLAITVMVQLAASDQTTWSYVLSAAEINAMGQGPESFTATQTDAAGNVSAESGALEVTVDTVPPQGLSMQPLLLGDKSIVNLALRNSPNGATLSGTCEEGGTLEITISNDTLGSFNRTVTATNGRWSYTLTDDDYSAFVEPVNYVFTITQTDDFGNTSTATQSFYIDVDPPEAPNLDQIVGAGTITTDPNQDLRVYGTGEAGCTVAIKFKDQTRFVDVVSRRWSYVLTPEDLQALGQGTVTFHISQSDAADNASEEFTADVFIDTVPPQGLGIHATASPSIINLAMRNDPSGGTISGVCEEGGTLRLVFATATGSEVFSVPVNFVGNTWGYTLTNQDYTALLLTSDYVLTIVQTDDVGNSSRAQQAYIIDTRAPLAPVVAAVSVDNAITSNEVGALLRGTGESGATVNINFAGVENRQVTVVNGNWSYALTQQDITSMGAGSETLTFVQTDRAGNASSAVTRVINVLPSALTINPIAGDNVINAEERAAGVTISGSCGANPARLVLRIGGVDRAITPSNGEWTYTLVDDDYRNMSAASQTLTITETDAQNNSNAASQSITVDTVAPDKPTVGIVSGENVISIDDLADNKTVAITGTRTSDVTAIELSIGNLTRTATLTPSGWTYTLSAQDLALLNQGSFSVTAVAIDSVGNRSAVSDPQSVLLDTIAPDAPTINTIADDNAINVIEDDNVINIAQRDAGVTITGTKDSGASVSLRFNGIDPVTGQAITVAVQLAASEQTTWSYVLSAGEINAMGQGSESFTATQTDAAGNVSEVSVALDATVDTVAPLAPTINTIATDNVINIAERDAQGGVTITGTKESGASGSLRFSWIDPVTGLTSSRSVRIAASDDTTWSYVLSAAEIDALDQGPVSVSATQLDAAGNRSEASRALVVTVDTIVPDAPRINTIATDNVINIDERDAQGGVTITGSREAGAKVFLSLGLRSDGTYAKAVEIPAATGTDANATTWSYVLTAADYVLMGEGPDRIRVVQQDAAGNTSAESTQDITVGFPVIAAFNAPTIDGISSGAILNAAERDAGVTISGTKDAGASVSLRFSGINPATGQAITVTVQVPASDQTTWSYVLSAAEINAMGQGPESFTATQTDAAGNVSVASAPFAISVDTVVSGLTIQTVAGNDVINLAERNATAGVAITGRKESGASIVLHMGLLSDGTYKRNVLLEATDGTTWSYTLSSQDYDNLGQGTVQVSVIQTDAAGNSSQVDRTITIDTLAPVLAIDPIAGIGDDNIINSAERARGVTITGIKEAGLAATLTIAPGFTLALPAAGGTWSYTLTDADYSRDGLGPKTMTLTQTDAAGNTSTAQLVIRVDFQSPGAPGFNTVGINDVINASQANSLLTGIDTIGSSSIVLTIGGVERIARITGPGISGSVNWEYRLTDQDIINMGQGEEILEARGVNAAGIRSSPATRTITVDTIAPVVAINPIAGIGDDNIINIDELSRGITITGRKDAGLAATLTIGRFFTLALPAAGSTWSYTFTDADYLLIGQGPKTITLTQTDAAGNTSTAPLVIALDFQAPTSPTFNAVAVDNAINVSETNVLISGLRGDGQSVVLTIGGFDRATTNSGSNWEYRLTAQDIANMGQGPETLQIRSFDAAGNSVSVSRDITVDTIVPVVAINPIAGIGDDNTINIAERAAGITITGIKDAGLAATLTIGTFFTLALPAAGGTWSYTLTDADYSRIGQGPKTMILTQTDAAGNTSTVTQEITLDFQAPGFPPTFNEIGINNFINVSQTTTLITGFIGQGEKALLTIGGVERATERNGNTWSYRLTSEDIANMGQGPETLEIRAVDAASNRSLPNTSTVTVDTIAPVVAINPTAGIGDDNTINIAERAAGITITGIKDAGRFATLTIGTGFTLALPAAGDTWSYTLTDADYSRIGQGKKAFTLIQTDAAGNTSTVTQEITLDFQAPSPPPAFNTVAGNDVISASETTTLITGFVGTPDSALLTIGGVERATERNGNTWSYRLTPEDITNMGQGTETLEIRAVDAAGNRSLAATRNITVNTVAPAQSADTADAMAQLAAATEPAAPDAGTPSESQALAAIWRAYNGAVDGHSGFELQPPSQPLSAGVGTTGGYEVGAQSAWLDANPGSLLAHQVL